MTRNVPLYGSVQIPQNLEPILATQTYARLRGISMDSIPANWMEYFIASLEEHSLGTLHVGMQIILANTLPQRQQTDLLVSLLLHDAGNPCFHHLAEGFLKMKNGHNGESFLEVMLHRDPNLCRILEDLGVSVPLLLAMVTGRGKPFSDVLHGSLDADNLDNVVRYWCRMGGYPPPFPPLAIASALRYINRGEGCWVLRRSAVHYAQCWQALRRILYRQFIYGEPHLASVMMLFRAVALAFYSGTLSDEFFFMDDAGAAEYLLAHNKESARLVELAAKRIRYTLVCERQELPGGVMERMCSLPDSRTYIADHLVSELRCRAGDVATYIGKGRGHRHITLPVLEEDGQLAQFPNGEHKPWYRVKVYLHPEIADVNKARVANVVDAMLR